MSQLLSVGQQLPIGPQFPCGAQALLPGAQVLLHEPGQQAFGHSAYFSPTGDIVGMQHLGAQLSFSLQLGPQWATPAPGRHVSQHSSQHGSWHAGGFRQEICRWYVYTHCEGRTMTGLQGSQQGAQSQHFDASHEVPQPPPHLFPNR